MSQSRANCWGSAAQPAAETLAEFMGSAAQPAVAQPGMWKSFCRLAFYNIGWNSQDKKHTSAMLAKEIKEIVQTKDVHAVGISEVFNARDDYLHDRRQQIMRDILDALHDTAAQPVWDGKVDAHYIFCWKTDVLKLCEYEVVPCGITEHSYRRAQYLQFRSGPDGEPLHIYHNHSPSRNRTLSDDRRKRILQHLYGHLGAKSSAAQPAAVFGGDWNSTQLQWEAQFASMPMSDETRKIVQICTSRAVPRHHGDRAVAINVRALQQDSGFGVSFKGCNNAFSDDHDVVLVPVYWDRNVVSSSRTDALPHGPSRPPAASQHGNSAAQPVSILSSEPPLPSAPRHASSSAGQLAPPDAPLGSANSAAQIAFPAGPSTSFYGFDSLGSFVDSLYQLVSQSSNSSAEQPAAATSLEPASIASGSQQVMKASAACPLKSALNEEPTGSESSAAQPAVAQPEEPETHATRKTV